MSISLGLLLLVAREGRECTRDKRENGGIQEEKKPTSLSYTAKYRDRDIGI
jgi:hypothetical protein